MNPAICQPTNSSSDRATPAAAAAIWIFYPIRFLSERRFLNTWPTNPTRAKPSNLGAASLLDPQAAPP